MIQNTEPPAMFSSRVCTEGELDDIRRHGSDMEAMLVDEVRVLRSEVRRLTRDRDDHLAESGLLSAQLVEAEPERMNAVKAAPKKPGIRKW